MRTGLILLCVLFFLGCSRHSCPGDQSVRKEFMHHLQVIEGLQKGKSTYVEEYRKSLFYIQFLTKIYSKADYSSTIGFYKNRGYKPAMRRWKKWYRQHECQLTQQYVDSVLRKYEYFKSR